MVGAKAERQFRLRGQMGHRRETCAARGGRVGGEERIVRRAVQITAESECAARLKLKADLLAARNLLRVIAKRDAG